MKKSSNKAERLGNWNKKNYSVPTSVQLKITKPFWEM